MDLLHRTWHCSCPSAPEVAQGLVLGSQGVDHVHKGRLAMLELAAGQLVGAADGLRGGVGQSQLNAELVAAALRLERFASKPGNKSTDIFLGKKRQPRTLLGMCCPGAAS